MKSIGRFLLGIGMAALGLQAASPSEALASVSGTLTISSSSHSANTASSNSSVGLSWSAVTGSSGTVKYEYVLDQTSSHTHATFTKAFDSGASTSPVRKVGQQTSRSVDFASLADGKYYFHLRAYDNGGLSQGTAVTTFGPVILDSKPALDTKTPVSPNSGDHSKEVTVTISGSGFMSGATVKLVNGVRSSGSNPSTSLSSVSLTITSVSANGRQIKAKVPSGTAPGVYDVKVINASPWSQSATTVGAYTSTNNAPTASAGSDQTVTLSGGNASITLTGTGSKDTDGDTLGTSAYTWTLNALPTGGSITSSGTALKQGSTLTGSTQTVVASTAGTYVFQLEVNDGFNKSSAATTTITVNAAAGTNNKPVAKAGSDQTVAPGTKVTLSGSSSSDPDGDNITSYVWTLTGVPTGSALTAGTAGAASAAITPAPPPSAPFTPGVRGV
ncbi:MAG: hypothetical protein HQL57_09915, partial [Magnetococcales bacterium]|nr:hypothetical protein [Magnetococcales bacterium]